MEICIFKIDIGVLGTLILVVQGTVQLDQCGYNSLANIIHTCYKSGVSRPGYIDTLHMNVQSDINQASRKRQICKTGRKKEKHELLLQTSAFTADIIQE